MTSKILLIGGIVVLLYLAKKKRDKAKEDKLFEEALQENEKLSCEEKIIQIRENFDNFIANNLPQFSDNQIFDIVMDLTSEVEEVFEDEQN